ncbi:ABC transporter substrate-binding protein [Corynebacterium glutamicum]|uniref:ABC transporter substrate-binding protein n=1 Tax=Corynebacterium glutamicum TaxID=1718 RepID=UPI001B8C382F|nr:iron-siderophore ABC transporter substrate-binding protein [Corynebacterium glutamicum]
MNSIHKSLSRSALIIGTVLALGLSGCSTANNEEVSNSDDVAVGGRLFSTADSATAALGSDAEPGAFPRTVVHSRGETTIEKRPERVVVLDSGEIDQVLSLGVTPVGISSPKDASSQPEYLADQLENVQVIGTNDDLNFEAIAALEPDLILGSKLRVDDSYEQLAQIAPTVLSIRPGFPWKENFLLTADALGLEEQAVTILNDYQTRVDQVRESIDGSPEISLVRFMPGRTRLYGNLSFIGVILKDLGLSRSEIQNIDDLAVEISPENIADANGDWIFYSTYGKPEATEQDNILSNELWHNLPAVQDGHALEVNDESWFMGLGPLGANEVLNDIENILGS